MSRTTKMYMEVSKVKGRQGIVTLQCKPVLKLYLHSRLDLFTIFSFSTTTITFLNLKNHPKLSQMDPL